MPLARPIVLVTEVVITASSHVDRDDSIDDLERSMEPNGDLSRPSTRTTERTPGEEIAFILR